MILYNIAIHCMVLHDIALHDMVSYGIPFYCIKIIIVGAVQHQVQPRTSFASFQLCLSFKGKYPPEAG